MGLRRNYFTVVKYSKFRIHPKSLFLMTEKEMKESMDQYSEYYDNKSLSKKAF